MKENQSHAESKGEEKVLYINRCSKVVKGGRKFSFSALVLVGDGEGKVGYGFAKANEVSDAIRKATEIARNSQMTFEMEGTTIPHSICVKQDGVRLLLKRAREGSGVMAGSVIRSVLIMAGVKDVVAKSFGSSNPNNQVRAAIRALSSLRNRESVLATRKAS